MNDTIRPEDFGLKVLTEKESEERERFHAKQRLEMGFCDEDLWSLDTTIAEFILPRLKRYREMPRMGYPGTLTKRQWNRKLDEILAAFEILADEHIRGDIEHTRIIKHGLRLFAEWFQNLWD